VAQGFSTLPIPHEAFPGPKGEILRIVNYPTESGKEARVVSADGVVVNQTLKEFLAQQPGWEQAAAILGPLAIKELRYSKLDGLSLITINEQELKSALPAATAVALGTIASTPSTSSVATASHSVRHNQHLDQRERNEGDRRGQTGAALTLIGLAIIAALLSQIKPNRHMAKKIDGDSNVVDGNLTDSNSESDASSNDESPAHPLQVKPTDRTQAGEGGSQVDSSIQPGPAMTDAFTAPNNPTEKALPSDLAREYAEFLDLAHEILTGTPDYRAPNSQWGCVIPTAPTPCGSFYIAGCIEARIDPGPPDCPPQ
jgi:hypothetical protein